MDNLPNLHTFAKLMYNQGVWEVEKHFVQDLGARPQHKVDKEGYEEVGGENDTAMDLQKLGDDGNWLGFMVGGQLDDLDFGLSQPTKTLDVGERHLGNQGIQCGLYEDDEEESNLMIFG